MYVETRDEEGKESKRRGKKYNFSPTAPGGESRASVANNSIRDGPRVGFPRRQIKIEWAPRRVYRVYFRSHLNAKGATMNLRRRGFGLERDWFIRVLCFF